ncbi:MAG: hypothetical protein R3E10_04405 [Gemmatimonadota bacterium]
MPRLGVYLCSISALVLSACHDSPTEAPSERLGPPALTAAGTAIPASACTRSWASGIGGLWVDSTRWSPAGVPAAGDVVCIDAPGTYTVNLSFSTDVKSIRIGGAGATVTLEWYPLLASTFAVSDTLEVAAGSRFDIPSVGGHVIGGFPGPTLINDGRITVSNPCACGGQLALFQLARIRNGGTLDLTAPVKFELESNGRVVNDGVIVGRTGQTSNIEFRPRPLATGVSWHQRAGEITGDAVMQAWFDFVWTGGVLDFTGGMPLAVWTGDLTIREPALEGTLYLFPGGGGPSTTRVTGIIGEDVTLRAFGDSDHDYVFDRLTAGPFIIDGTLMVASTAVDSVALSFPGLLNRGELRLTTGGATISSDSIVNRGEMRLSGGGTLSVDGPGVVQLKNKGFIDANGASLRMTLNTIFQANSLSTMVGVLELDHAVLFGPGSVGDVIGSGARIEPGNGVGTLTMASADLDNTTTVALEVGGPDAGDYDQLVVTGSFRATGNLTLSGASPYEGGECGQVLDVITDDGTAGPTFSMLGGYLVDNNHAWRLHQAPGRTRVVAYDFSADVAVGPPTLTLAEGGATKSYSVCLGATPPSADVTVTPSSALGEVVTDGAKTFTVADWALPLAYLTSAVDDAVAEGLHSDTIRHAVTSADPAYSGAAAQSVVVQIADNDVDADLELTQVSQQDNRFVGDTMNSVFRVTNLGPSSSSGSTVTTTPLQGLAFLSASGASCTVDGAGVVTCTLGPVAAGAPLEFTLTFEGTVVGLHSQTLTVAGLENDPNGANDAVIYTQRVN